MGNDNFIKKVWYKNWGIVYHTLLGMPVLVNQRGWDLLEGSKKIVSIETFDVEKQLLVNTIRKDYFEKTENQINEEFDRMINEYINNFVNNKCISSLSLYITRACNFKCTYCIHDAATNAMIEKPVELFMSFELAKRAIDMYFNNLARNNSRNANIEIIGGEPLLNWEVLKNVFEYTFNKYKSKYEINFGIVTNLTLLNEEIINVFKEYNIPISTSIDGLVGLQDKSRIYKDGRATYTDIIKGLELAREVNHPIPGFNFTMTKDNMGSISKEFIRQVKNWGFQFMHGDFDLLDVYKDIDDTEVDKLMEILYETFTNDIQMNGTFSSPFVNLMNGHYFSGLRTFCDKLRGMNFSVDPDGKIFVCNYIPITIGDIDNINELFDSENFISLIKSFFQGQKQTCKYCEIEGLCCGGCPSPGAIKRENEMVSKGMCAIYKKAFNRLLVFVIETCLKGESSIRKLFYPSEMVESLIDIFSANGVNSNEDIVIQPIGGVKMNLCSGGLSFNPEKEKYHTWYDKLKYNI